MWNEHLHIVSLNIPLPANYGGMIDIWHKAKALSDLGIKVHLHCFEYGRSHQKELEDTCYSVNYYKRHTGLASWLSNEPYIVKSRENNELLQNLIAFDAPILFEGLHTTHFIANKELKDRFKIVRAHNIEHEYYNGLKRQEHNLLKKFFFLTESHKLERYEKKAMPFAQLIASITEKDTDYFSSTYGHSTHLPAFQPNSAVCGKTDFGKHILYHANLSVPENIEASLFLAKALRDINFPIIFAGKDPDKALAKAVSTNANIAICANPTSEQMDKLVEDAQIIALPTFQPTGIKLKLLESLYKGRHCVANRQMVAGTGLESLCHIADSAEEFAQICRDLISKPFDINDLQNRSKLLSKFDASINAQKLIDLIDNALR